MPKNKRIELGNIIINEGAFNTNEYSEDEVMELANNIYCGTSKPTCDCEVPTIVQKKHFVWIRWKLHHPIRYYCKVCKKQITWVYGDYE